MQALNHHAAAGSIFATGDMMDGVPAPEWVQALSGQQAPSGRRARTPPADGYFCRRDIPGSSSCTSSGCPQVQRSSPARKKSAYLRDRSDDEAPPSFGRSNASSATTSVPTEGSSSGPVSVLVVDDSSGNQLALKRLVRTIGKRVLGAPPRVVCVDDGAQAVQAAQETRFALVLMDIHMPVMGGVQATELIRKRFSADELPILAVTADTQTGSLMRHGFTGVVEKPVAAPQMQAWLEECLRPVASAADVVMGDDSSSSREGSQDSTGDPDVLASSATSWASDASTF